MPRNECCKVLGERKADGIDEESAQPPNQELRDLSLTYNPAHRIQLLARLALAFSPKHK